MRTETITYPQQTVDEQPQAAQAAEQNRFGDNSARSVDWSDFQREMWAPKVVPHYPADKVEDKQAKFPELAALQAFHSPDCKLTHSVRPDGTSETVQRAPDGSTRTQVRHPDGREEAKVADRYGRPQVVETRNQDGSWSVSEMAYSDTAGKISPFLASKRTTNSDGKVVVMDFNTIGKFPRKQDFCV